MFPSVGSKLVIPVMLAALASSCSLLDRNPENGVSSDRRLYSVVSQDRVIQSEIEKQIDAQYGSDHDVDVVVHNQKVLLIGEVINRKEKESIAKFSRNMKNVKTVVNRITVAWPASLGTKAKDTFITAAIKTRLAAQSGLPSHAIRVFTHRGTVYLMGLVSSSEEREAVKLARSTTGVRTVILLTEVITEDQARQLEKKRLGNPRSVK